MSALSKQVGGDHYRKLKIQPVEYIHANNIPFIEGCIIKYASRWRDKGGVKDLEKIKHFAELLIDLESRSMPAACEYSNGIDDESPRAQAIGQNGNDGLHYPRAIIQAGDFVEYTKASNDEFTKGKLYLVSLVDSSTAPYDVIDDAGDENCLGDEECKFHHRPHKDAE